jgi:hypothetical protein
VIKLPFTEIKISDNKVERVFSKNLSDDELQWHIDDENRIVKVCGTTDWMIQLDNNLPIPIPESVYIPKGMYHRLIKGTSDLHIKVLKLK